MLVPVYTNWQFLFPPLTPAAPTFVRTRSGSGSCWSKKLGRPNQLGRSPWLNEMPCAGGECYSACTNAGHLIEANVHAFLWDIFDNTNDATQDTGIDTISRARSFILNWSSNYTSFPHFYDDFRIRGLWGDEESVTNQLRKVNRVQNAQ